MRIYYDLEFVENGVTIDPVSIGMVAEDGRRLYRVFDSRMTIDALVRDDWLRTNVAPGLPIELDGPLNGGVWRWYWDLEHEDVDSVVDRHQIAADVKTFIQLTPDVQLWSWYGAYDHVALCQLWGRMVDLPDGIPMWTNDLQQEIVRLGVGPEDAGYPEQGWDAHNALADAEYHMELGEYLRERGRHVG